MLQIFKLQQSSKPILNELHKIYYEGQIQVPMIKKYTDNDDFMHTYNERHQWTEWYIYESIFGQVIHHLIIIYIAQI